MLIDRTGKVDIPYVPITIDQLPDDMLGMIFTLASSNLQNIERVNKRFERVIEEQKIWKTRITNLDLKGADLSRYGFDPLQSTVSDRILFLAGRAACIASEDGEATILTLPAGWSLEQLERVSQAAVAAGITSAAIRFWNNAHRVLLTPLQEEQTVVLTNTVIHGSRNQNPQVQAALLESKGFGSTFPDALIVLTMTVFTRIVTQGHLSSLYHVNAQGIWSYTRCQQKTADHESLVVGGSAPSYADVDHVSNFGHDDVGVGGLRKFRKTSLS